VFQAVPIFDRNFQKLIIKFGVKTRFLWVCEECPDFWRKKDGQSSLIVILFDFSRKKNVSKVLWSIVLFKIYPFKKHDTAR
jgi:hypothetical protein